LGIDLLYGVFSLAILGVVLCYTWLLAPIAPRWMSGIATMLVVMLAVARAVKTGEWGLRPRAFLPSLAWSTLLTVAAATAIYVAGSLLGTWHERPPQGSVFALLLPWGLGQQFALQTVFLRDAQALTSRRTGTVLAAIMFAALHLPNPFLALVTGVAAVGWCWIYDRYPNVLPLAFSHAVLTLAVLYAFDDATTGRLRVGAAYLDLR
jgi:membrane protease YdiL (CAAX protease family)